MPRVEMNGTQFNVEVTGPDNAPVLMLSNSLGTDLHMWDEQVDTWSQRFRVVRYDRRGHGKSSASEGPYNFDLLGADALALMDALGLDKVNWCGLSMGGMVGQWLGAKAPDRLNSLVLANTHYYFENKRVWDDRIALVTREGLGALADVTIERWLNPLFRGLRPDVVENISKMFKNTSVDGYAGCCAALRDMDFTQSNRQIAVPTLVIGGTLDRVTTLDAAKELQSQIAGAELVELNAAHLSNIECPGAFADAVLRFVSRNSQ